MKEELYKELMGLIEGNPEYCHGLDGRTFVKRIEEIIIVLLKDFGCKITPEFKQSFFDFSIKYGYMNIGIEVKTGNLSEEDIIRIYKIRDIIANGYSEGAILICKHVDSAETIRQAIEEMPIIIITFEEFIKFHKLGSERDLSSVLRSLFQIRERIFTNEKSIEIPEQIEAIETIQRIPKLKPSLGISNEAMGFFGLKREPFFMDDIPVNLMQTSDLLVRTRGIKDMNGLLERFLNDKKSRIILIEGHRGSGKTTAVNYLFSELLRIREERGIFILSCSIDIPKARPSHEEIKKYVHKTLLRTLIDEIQGHEYAITGVAQAEEAFKGDDLVQIDHEIHRLLYAISSAYKRIILFIDNLDKVDPKNWVEVEQYFSSNQAFYTTKLMSGLQKDSYIYLVITAQKWMGTWLVNQVQYMMGSMEIRLDEWLLRETNLLFKKRIQWASDREINPKYYFEGPALTYIHAVNQALPRYVMRAWQQILNKAAEEKERPVRLKFCRKYRELVKGINLESDLASNVEILSKRLRRECPKTYRKLFRCLEKVEAENVLSVMDALISIYLNEYTDDKPSADLLLKHGLIEESETKEGEITRYKVDKLIENMFKITEEQFKGDSEAISLLLYEWM